MLDQDFNAAVSLVRDDWGTTFDLVKQHPYKTMRDQAEKLSPPQVLPSCYAAIVEFELANPRNLPRWSMKLRNLIVVEAVAWAHKEFHVNVTRSHAHGSEATAEGGSAADIVAAAFSMTFTNVAKCWHDHDKNVKSILDEVQRRECG